VTRLPAAAVAAALAIAGLTACTAASQTPAAAPASTAPVVKATAPSAPCATPERAGQGLPEQQGSGSLWALYFPTTDGATYVRARHEAKIVVRMTGSGDLTILAEGPAGATVKPVWGPEGHGGSTWTRPGDEWGTGWNFPTAGCWTVRATRADGSTGDLNILVGG
jgi:hypothetical protein